LVNARALTIHLHDLLDTACGKRGPALRLEEGGVLGMRVPIGLQDQTEASRKEDIAVLPAFALRNKDLALRDVHIARPDPDQLTDPHGRIEEQL
jgi:hypothetical protein